MKLKTLKDLDLKVGCERIIREKEHIRNTYKKGKKIKIKEIIKCGDRKRGKRWLCRECEENNRIREEIKQEAIKWVKECCYITCEEGDRCYGCEKLMNFHNITEEDLK
jgi:hypothetical protein